MPAFNMNGVAAANPSAGKQVLMSPFSGPKNSPFDAKVASYYDNLPGGVAWAAPVNDPDNLSTGALSTGIGFGPSNFDGSADNQPGRVLPDQNFTDNYVPGTTMPNGTGAGNSRFVAIGGGRMVVTLPDETPVVTPYTAGESLQAFGGGGSRDAGAGPVFTGFFTKTVTAVGAVAVGAAVEAGYVNRTSYALDAGKTVFGVSVAAAAALS